MSKSKVRMPEYLKNKCHAIIHSAAVGAGAAGAIPIPVADAVPITATQIGMIISLGKVFDVTLSQSVAKSIAGSMLARQLGQAAFRGILKFVPIAGNIAGATTAFALTETLGWMIADDFYRMSIGENPENIIDEVENLKNAFRGI